MLDYNKNLRQPARQLRKTEAERLLRSHTARTNGRDAVRSTGKNR